MESHNTSVYAQYTLAVDSRDAVQQHLQEQGIPTAVHYPVPLNRQPAVADDTADLSAGDRAASRVISLPMHPYLDEADQETIVVALRSAVAAV